MFYQIYLYPNFKFLHQGFNIPNQTNRFICYGNSKETAQNHPHGLHSNNYYYKYNV